MKAPRHITEEEFTQMVKKLKREKGGVERHVVIAADLRITSDGTFPQTRAGVNPAPSPLAQSFTLYGQLCSGKNQIQLLWRNGKVQQ